MKADFKSGEIKAYANYLIDFFTFHGMNEVNILHCAINCVNEMLIEKSLPQKRIEFLELVKIELESELLKNCPQNIAAVIVALSEANNAKVRELHKIITYE